jgi:hypothetical protein
MKFYLFIFLSIFILSTSRAQVNQYTYIENDGVVAIEAEKYTTNKGAWEEVEGRTAYPKELQGLGVAYGEKVEITSGQEGLNAGLTGTVTVFNETDPLNCALPNANAKIIARVKKEPQFATFFVYEKGTEMPGGKAAGMRIGIFNGRETLTPEGKNLFKSAFSYAREHSNGNDLLYVTNNANLEGHDGFMADILKTMGFNLNVIEDEELETEDANGMSMVFVSESVGSGPVGDKFKNIEIPVIIAEPYIFDDMGMVLTQEKWEFKEGQVGNAMLIRYGDWEDYLRYAVYFNNAGKYNIWLLGKNAGTDEAQKVHIFFNTNKIAPDTDHNKLELQKDLSWVKGEKKIEVPEEGWYNVYVAKGNDQQDGDKTRYPNWRVDKIVLTTSNDDLKADGPAITLNNGKKEVPDEYLTNEEFMPSQVWKIENGYVVLEAEHLDYHNHWKLKTKPQGFTGEGYIEWQGPNRTRSIEGLGGNDDEIYVRQGPQDEWLIIPVMVKQPGRYAVNVVNHHELEDGDNDAWVNIIGFRPYNKDAWDSQVRRMGDSFDDGEGFTWLDWGVRELPLEEGLNHIYIGGRSIGWGIDRIAIYKASDKKAKRKATDRNTTVSSIKQKSNE